jgi:hypothetical protein
LRSRRRANLTPLLEAKPDTAAEVIKMANGEQPGPEQRTHRNEWNEAGEIAADLYELDSLRAAAIFDPSGAGDALFRAAMTYALNVLRDLVAKERLRAMRENGRSAVPHGQVRI